MIFYVDQQVQSALATAAEADALRQEQAEVILETIAVRLRSPTHENVHGTRGTEEG